MTYESKDLHLSGYILAMGLQLQSHRLDECGDTVFCFEQTDKLDKLVEEYYNLTALISPQRYGASLKILKNLLYQSRNNYNNYDKQSMSNYRRKSN